MDAVIRAKVEELCDSASSQKGTFQTMKRRVAGITHDKGVDNSTGMKSQDPSNETLSNQNQFHPIIASVDSDFENFVKLCRVAKNCKEIKEIYNGGENQIMISIAADAQKKVDDFLEKNDFKDDIKNGRIFLVQHENKPTEFLFGPGAKLTSQALLHQIGKRPQDYINKHPDDLRCYNKIATVSCLGQDASGQTYILTAGHVFDYDTPHGDTFLTCFKNKITFVSQEKKAFFISIPMRDQTHGIEGLVDVAALKLRPDIQGLITENMLNDLKPIYKNSLSQMKDELRDNTVYKHGAISGTTCGKILDPCVYYSEDPHGICFIIKSEDDQPFAQPGDSGSLIWNANGVPIGIVSMQNSNHTVYPNSPTINVTYGVRLDWCIWALNKSGIEIESLQVFGSPIPVKQNIPSSQIVSAGSQQAISGIRV